MVRGIAFLVGAAFAAVLAWALFWTVQGYGSPIRPRRQREDEFHLHPRAANLASDGVMGKFDKQQLQRGFQVYKEVCSACHSLRFVAFRELEGHRL